ncbi:bi-domain-containing oxidoreductase [Cohnella boryungensis]|uniref:Bi-domain-containing oxidoreductase n=1 Tax=Cohnella boryungensis TaxID=768479 RepID=A0ABV8SAR9_9BACL
MKQILQNLKNGNTELVDIPEPQLKPGHLLIKTRASVVSAGTEKMLVDFGKANLLEKAKQQPDRVKQALNKIKTDGILPTVQAIRTKLDQPLPLGYSNVGTVIAVGQGVSAFKPGDRVVSNGHHAEVVCVPQNLCALVPEEVSDEDAAFTVIAAIGLQGIRLAQPTIGEVFVVMGLGLIGILTAQLLLANGCKVIGTDYNSERIELARKLGVIPADLSKNEDVEALARTITQGRGVDGVLITASTKSNEPVHQGAQMCRKRGRLVLIGVTGLELSRADFYEKELSFQVSCSYGPGRYDPSYEEKGNDYPLGFVRWTEQRNFEAVLEIVKQQRIDIKSLITHHFEIDQAKAAYQALSDGKALGIVLKYIEYNSQMPVDAAQAFAKSIQLSSETLAGQAPGVGMIGAGNYSNQVLIPAIKRLGVPLVNIASSGGVNGAHVGKRYGFARTTTDVRQLIEDENVNCLFITTRHDSHAQYAIEALSAGKHVFVEKPLCLTHEDLARIKKLQLRENQVLTVGFNRRFSPLITRMKRLLDQAKEPKAFVYTVNAGAIPKSHWTQDEEIGGGRIIGEACHFIDTIRFLANSNIKKIQLSMMGAGNPEASKDNVTFTLSFEDGSIGTVHYLANGHKSFPKERLEAFVSGKILQLDNYRVLKGSGWSNFKKEWLWTQDKGQKDCVKSFIDAVRLKKGPPIPLDEIFEVTETSFRINEQIKLS